jgi:hypothetical protein
MMLARRMDAGSRFAVQAGLALMESHDVNAIVFSSRHGELERMTRNLLRLAPRDEFSPADFTASVHNAAAGQLTIIAKKTVPVSSVAACEDSFHQALFEVGAFLAGGCERVLLVDFENEIPAVYRRHMAHFFPAPYAAAFIIQRGGDLCCSPVAHERDDGVGGGAGDDVGDGGGAGAGPDEAGSIPPSLAFLRGWLRGESGFRIRSESCDWRWENRSRSSACLPPASSPDARLTPA